MADQTPTRSYKPIYWILVIVAFLALSAWAYVGTRRSNHDVAQAEASGAGVGTAYNPTTGKVEGAGATPGALGASGPPTPSVAGEVVTAPATPANANGGASSSQ